jgi:hypothetical protein
MSFAKPADRSDYLAWGMIRLSVRVHPRASCNEVRERDGQVEVWTTAPAVDGKANQAVLRLIAEWKGVPVSRVSLLHGRTARVKQVEVR